MSALRGAPIRLVIRGTSSKVFIRSYGLGKSGLERRIISTLDPKLLEPGDILEMSHKKTARINFPGSDTRGLGALLIYVQTKDGRLPFPPNSRGFLYYHSEPPASPLESSVRFRLAPDNTPSSFLHGQDLLTPWGLPWRILLPQIACHAEYTKIRQQLQHEDLATSEQFSQCRDVFHGHRIHPEYTLFRLDSTFLVNFSGKIHITTVGDVLHSVYLEPHRDEGYNSHFCLSGSAHARFEPSTRPEHAGCRVVHLRILKIVEPVAFTMEGYAGRVVKPKEGELLTVSVRGSVPEPWAYDIDLKTKHGAALRALWDKSGVS
ncbi:hypothetical protein C8R44DRAFT_800346 [Mycena epipterygia]|nr:hypothetical protein C8R44DRAFT_800346 [Mycena epipterygia]